MRAAGHAMWTCGRVASQPMLLSYVHLCAGRQDGAQHCTVCYFACTVTGCRSRGAADGQLGAPLGKRRSVSLWQPARWWQHASHSPDCICLALLL